MTGLRSAKSSTYWFWRFFEAVTTNELPKWRATVTPTSDLPTPVGAHSTMFGYPDPMHDSISEKMRFWIGRGTNGAGTLSSNMVLVGAGASVLIP